MFSFLFSFYCSQGSNDSVFFGGNSLLYADGGTQSLHRQEECLIRKQSVPLDGDKCRLGNKRNLQLASSSFSGNTTCVGQQSAHNINCCVDAIPVSAYSDEVRRLEAKLAATQERLAVVETSLLRDTGYKRSRFFQEDVIQQPVETAVLQSDVTRCAIHAVFDVLCFSQQEERWFMKRVLPYGVLNSCDLKTLGVQLKSICNINLEKLYSEKKERDFRKSPTENWMGYLRRQTKGRFIAHVKGHCLGIDLDHRIVYGVPNCLQIHFDSWKGFGDDDKFVEDRLLTNYTHWYNHKF